MKHNIQIINGPNLNLLGKREPHIYGTKSFETYFEELEAAFPDVNLYFFQSNHEGSIIDKIQDVGFRFDGIVLNAGALSHYSYSIADAIISITAPVAEVHISDIYQREEFRKISVTGVNCVKLISGKGLEGYREAIQYLIDNH